MALNAKLRRHKPKKSMAGSLAKYYKKYSADKMVKEIKEEKRKLNRF